MDATAKRTRDSLNRLVDIDRPRQSLRRLDAIGARSNLQGRASIVRAAAGGGSGIASPLTETGVRDYWEGGLTSSDGLFILPAIKTLRMTDAAGRAVTINLAEQP